jgi:Tfp pilus assembly protein PilF
MALTLADQYYLKALDGYDYNLDEVIENLNYALSYDQEHAGANYLMGKFYMEQMHQFDLAKEYFEASMVCDPTKSDTCQSFSWLLIRTRQFSEALKLIRYAYGLPGAMMPDFLRLEALVHELQKDYSGAVELLNEAIDESYDDSYVVFLEAELARVEKKMRRMPKVTYHFVD